MEDMLVHFSRMLPRLALAGVPTNNPRIVGYSSGKPDLAITAEYNQDKEQREDRVAPHVVPKPRVTFHVALSNPNSINGYVNRVD